MKSAVLLAFLVVGVHALAQQNVPQIPFDANPEFLQLPENLYLGEASGVAVNSKGLLVNKKDWLAAIANDEGKCDINKGFEHLVRVYGNSGLVIHTAPVCRRL